MIAQVVQILTERGAFTKAPQPHLWPLIVCVIVQASIAAAIVIAAAWKRK